MSDPSTSQNDAPTIVALASGRGQAGVAVLRLSGPRAGAALEALTGKALPPPRTAALRRIAHPDTDETLDQGLVLWFPGPASFTGEDVAEFHLHGGPAVIDAVMAALRAVPGLASAEPGAFSRRAFEHGKLDLTQTEAIADLVAAETEAQRKQALRQMDGALGALYEGWRGGLIRALAHLEADLDFPDEDLPGGIGAQVAPVLARLRADIAAHLDDDRRGEALRDGFQVVVTGPPNAGKSSLINALAKRDVAIVSPTPGTTRDMIEVRLNLGGYPVTLVDTAGLREAGDAGDPIEAIEAEGVRRARARAAQADLTIFMVDASSSDMPFAHHEQHPDFIVLNKTDLCPLSVEDLQNRLQSDPETGQNLPHFRISVHTGDGLDTLIQALEADVVARMSPREAPSLTRARHRTALEDAGDHLARAETAIRSGAEPELIAEDVRLAARSLGRITGRVDVEDILDVVFADFCIGK